MILSHTEIVEDILDILMSALIIPDIEIVDDILMSALITT